jgi:hypothetical protein
VVAEFDWRFAECARACRQVTRYMLRSHISKMLMVGFWALVLIILAFSVVVVIASPDDRMTRFWEMAPWILVLLLGIGLRFGGAAWLTAWRVKRNNPHLVAGSQHFLSAAGYRVRCGQVESSISWAGLVRSVETDDFFLSFPTRNTAYFLPKRALTAAQTETIRSLMREHLLERFVQVGAARR